MHGFLAPFWALATEMLGETAAATAVGFINAVGSVAGFAGPYAFGYLNTRTGSFSAGLTVMLISCLGSGLLLLRAPEAPKPVLQLSVDEAGPAADRPTLSNLGNLRVIRGGVV